MQVPGWLGNHEFQLWSPKEYKKKATHCRLYILLNTTYQRYTSIYLGSAAKVEVSLKKRKTNVSLFN